MSLELRLHFHVFLHNFYIIVQVIITWTLTIDTFYVIPTRVRVRILSGGLTIQTESDLLYWVLDWSEFLLWKQKVSRNYYFI